MGGGNQFKQFDKAGSFACLKDRDRKLWACALWVEKHHGTEGPAYIARQAERLALDGDAVGFDAWQGVATRFDALAEDAERARQ